MSCGQIALKRAGIAVKTYYASEINPYAIKATMHNFPSTIQLGSITDVHAKDLPKIDLFIGGSPCQGFSRAGKGLNFDDPRSQLFFEYVRLWNEIKAINPNAKFLLENVRMLKEWENIISKYMGINPVMINSSLVSAQNRERLYWNNFNLVKYGLFDCIKNEIPQPKDKKIFLKDILETEVAEKYFLSDKMIGWISKHTEKRGTKLNIPDINGKTRSLNVVDKKMNCETSYIVHNTQPRSGDPKKGGTGHLCRTDGKVYCLDTGNTNAVEINTLYVSGQGEKQHLKASTLKASTLKASSSTNPKSSGTNLVLLNKKHQQDNINNVNGKARSLVVGSHQNSHHFTKTEVHSRIRRLTPKECCRLQTVPDTYFWDEHGKNIISDSRIYECLGNGWTVDVIVHLLNFYKQHLNS